MNGMSAIKGQIRGVLFGQTNTTFFVFWQLGNHRINPLAQRSAHLEKLIIVKA
jgi:hypothetical protein